MTSFIGHVPASKSIFNRALILQSFGPDLKICGVSDSDDVVKIKAGIKALKDQAMIDCGEGGTVLRFLALRASREKGRHKLTGSVRLINRPQEELMKILSQLGVTGRTLTPLEDGLRVGGVLQKTRERSVFNPDRDHRLAMAAGVLKLAGIPIHIENPEVVNKSFAGFWQSAGIDPS
jgi:5-enolpyruvylshikimate-3-phosphate synthase